MNHSLGRRNRFASSASPPEAAGRKPGVENMLGHAPTPLTANGLDMRVGHPADGAGTTSEVLTPRRRDAALFQDRVGARERKRFLRLEFSRGCDHAAAASFMLSPSKNNFGG